MLGASRIWLAYLLRLSTDGLIAPGVGVADHLAPVAVGLAPRHLSVVAPSTTGLPSAPVPLRDQLLAR